jgi:hypothetical protein
VNISYGIHLTAIGLTPGGSSTVHISTQTVNRLTPGGSSTVHIYTQTIHRLTPGGSSTVHISTQTVNRLTPGGSSTVHIYTQTVQQYSTHLHTNSTQNTGNGTHIKMKGNKIWEVRAVPRLCELYPGICLTFEEKSPKNLS